MRGAGVGCLRAGYAKTAGTNGGDRLSAPQAYFVQKIAGDLVSVQVIVALGTAHAYEPTAEQMRVMTKSRLYFSIGVEFEEAWLPRFMAANPALEIVDLGRRRTAFWRWQQDMLKTARKSKMTRISGFPPRG